MDLLFGGMDTYENKIGPDNGRITGVIEHGQGRIDCSSDEDGF